MPQLDSTWFASQLFWLLISFVALYAVLSRLVLPPLMEILARRLQTVDGDIERAQRCKSEAEQARQNYERTLAEARARAQQLVSDAVLAQKTAMEEATKELDADIAVKLASAERKIAEAKQKLTDALMPATAEITAMIVEKLTKQTPAPGKLSALVQEFSKSGGGK